MFLWAEGLVFLDHQQFHIEKITFLKTSPRRKCPLWQKARITLLTANRGMKVKVETASLRNDAPFWQTLTEVHQPGQGLGSRGH